MRYDKILYEFNIEGNEIVCNYVGSNYNNKYMRMEAVKRLRHTDNFRYNKVIIGKNELKLIGNDVKIVFNNFERFNKSNILNKYFKKTMKLVKKSIVLNQMSRFKDMTLSNISLEHKRAIAGIMTTTLLLTGSHMTKVDDLNIYFDEVTMDDDKSDTVKDIDTSNIVGENDNKVTIDENRVSSIEEEIHNQMKKSNESMINQDVNVVSGDIRLNLENISNGPKSRNVLDNYKDIIDFYSKKWGLSSNLVSSILTQESGGYNANLMQVEFNTWKDQIITAYNFNDNCYQSIVLTDDPSRYKNNIMCISRSEFLNPKTNISIGSIILAYSLKAFDYNIPLAITAYNFGVGNVNKVLNATSYGTGKSIDELIHDTSNLEFLKYRNIIKVGDPKYFEHVMQYVENYKDGITAFNKENETLYRINADYEDSKTNAI